MEDKKVEITILLSQLDEPMLEFLDLESNEMLDEKIEVLTALIEGKTIEDIPNFYKILENYPTGMWD